MKLKPKHLSFIPLWVAVKLNNNNNNKRTKKNFFVGLLLYILETITKSARVTAAKLPAAVNKVITPVSWILTSEWFFLLSTISSGNQPDRNPTRDFVWVNIQNIQHSCQLNILTQSRPRKPVCNADNGSVSPTHHPAHRGLNFTETLKVAYFLHSWL